MIYDITIIGGGIGGLMAAYQLITKDNKLKIAIFERGTPLNKRHCPAAEKHIPCCHCKSCAITEGYAGAGAFSDGKFNLGTAYGGTLGEELGDDVSMNYIGQLDDILRQHSVDYPDIYQSDEALKLKCLQNNLRLLDMNVRHLGSDRNRVIMANIINHLQELGVEMHYNSNIVDVSHGTISTDNFLLTVSGDNKIGSVSAKNVIVATGRGGAEFVKNICNKFNINISSNIVDLGVRVEMRDDIWKEFSSKIYEPKILCRTKTFEDKTRMFCFNQGGVVSTENNQSIITANGHSYADPSKKTKNCNFAILSSIYFTEPFNQPTEYVKNIARLANAIGNNNVLVQRFGDLIRGRRTNEHRLSQNSVEPTLKATAGDLSLVLPHRILTNIIETLYALDKVSPGTANDDTLIYGVEAKYYSLKPAHNNNFEIAENLYLIGDGSGITRGLSQAGAMGLYVGDKIIENCK